MSAAWERARARTAMRRHVCMSYRVAHYIHTLRRRVTRGATVVSTESPKTDCDVARNLLQASTSRVYFSVRACLRWNLSYAGLWSFWIEWDVFFILTHNSWLHRRHESIQCIQQRCSWRPNKSDQLLFWICWCEFYRSPTQLENCSSSKHVGPTNSLFKCFPQFKMPQSYRLYR